MPEQTIDLKKRRFLTQATSVVGAVGVGFVAWPFLSTWKPSARTRAAGAPVDVDISKLQTGQLVRVLWRKKPVWIFKRSAEALAALESDAVIKNLSDQSILDGNTVLNQNVIQGRCDFYVGMGLVFDLKLIGLIDNNQLVNLVGCNRNHVNIFHR